MSDVSGMRRFVHATWVAIIVTSACAVPALAQDGAAVERGRAKYEHTCAPCHGAGLGDDGRQLLPGTDALRIKYGGALPALLEERTDLNAEVLKVFVRRGTWSMPPFRPTEVTDREIADIAAYLQQTSSERAR